MHDTISRRRDADHPERFWRRLLHRWFVEYNPLYLFSASLVLGGIILISRGLAQGSGSGSEIGVAAIAELYAVALIGGAAFLTRIGHRRPAVMLALLTVLYQYDLTLHTETCKSLGAAGVWAAGGWLVLFVAKLHALAWAMKIRLARSAVATLTLGALGLAVLPHWLHGTDARSANAMVVLWLVGGVSLYRPGAVTSLVELDAWGQTVLRRAVTAAWLLSALLLALHVLFWSTQSRLSIAALAAVAPLLGVRWIRSEVRVWCVVMATLLVVGLKLPGAFSVTAFVAAVALVLRASRSTLEAFTHARRDRGRAVARPSVPAMPYRVRGSETPMEVDAPAMVSAGSTEALAAARRRLLIGAGAALYLSLWTFGWSGGPWPAHVLGLDLLATVAVVLATWKAGARIAMALLAMSMAHFVVQARLVPAPRSLLEWGAIAVVLGFVLLIASLVASWFLRAPRVASGEPPEQVPETT
ncbi:MAG: hypothetical protein J0I07_40695 [Myxococcales bacterium]|nr:hypothetical protein [Myxococcales bacterium]